MPLAFRDCRYPPLEGLSVSAPDGAVIGIIGEEGSGQQELLELAAGLRQPVSGEVVAAGPVRLVGPMEAVSCDGGVRTLLLFHALALKDAVARHRALLDIEHLRRRGGTVLVVSHDLDLVASAADEVWWLDKGVLKARGDAREAIGTYRRHVANRLKANGAGRQENLPPSLRAGDGRAELVSIETLGAAGAPAAVWRTGEECGIRVTVRFRAAVAEPVVGIMIRTRIGFEVFGTNTELERQAIGACQAGDQVHVTYRFPCHLCPGEYTVTAASHDPDGVWHDWMEDGVAVSVADDRYTAGVACLRARVEVGRS